MEKGERFKLFVQRLESDIASADAESALATIVATLNGVEDEFSGVPYCPSNWMQDGRMYPPQADYERASDDPRVRIFRARGHRILSG